MRGGTLRFPGWDGERYPGLYKFLLYLSPDVYMEARNHVKTRCRDGMDGGMILVY